MIKENNVLLFVEDYAFSFFVVKHTENKISIFIQSSNNTVFQVSFHRLNLKSLDDLCGGRKKKKELH